MNKKMQDMLKNLNQGQLKEINAFLNSAKGSKFKNSLSGVDKDRLMREFSKLSESDVKKTLANMSENDLRRIINNL